MSAKEILDIYFIDNRARLLEIASFLDRMERTHDSEEGKKDFRYRAFSRALEILVEMEGHRTKAIQLMLSDQTDEPVETAAGLMAVGAWEGAFLEDH